jgi:hypothetical protein
MQLIQSLLLFISIAIYHYAFYCYYDDDSKMKIIYIFCIRVKKRVDTHLRYRYRVGEEFRKTGQDVLPKKVIACCSECTVPAVTLHGKFGSKVAIAIDALEP